MKRYPLIVVFFLVLTPSCLAVDVSGEEIWDENAFLRYRIITEETIYNASVDLEVITDNEREFYVSIEYTDIVNDKWMIFDIAMEGSDRFLVFKDQTQLTVNAGTGMTDSGEYTGLFYDTSVLEDLEQFEPVPNLLINHTYQGIQISHEVLFGGDYNYFVQGAFGRERIPGYALVPVINDEYLGQYAISQRGGVLLSAWSTIEIDANDTTKFDLDFRINLIDYDNVKLSSIPNRIYNSPLAQIFITTSIVGIIYFVALRYNPFGKSIRWIMHKLEK